VTLTWNSIRTTSAKLLKKYVDTAISTQNGLLYLTVPYNNGTIAGRTFIDVSGVVHPTDLTEGGLIPRSVGMYYQGLIIFVNNLIIANNPAEFD